MAVADGAYAKRPFLKRVKATGVVVVIRLRKDAVLFDVPEAAKCPGRGRPRKYGRNQISLAHRGGHRHGRTTARVVLYGKELPVTFKTFLAAYAPAGGVIRVVIVTQSVELFSDGSAECVALSSTALNVPPDMIIESVVDRSAVEQNVHDVKEVDVGGEQQVRNV
jgi:hypothetical protein